jgi:hypothetical protein
MVYIMLGMASAGLERALGCLYEQFYLVQLMPNLHSISGCKKRQFLPWVHAGKNLQSSVGWMYGHASIVFIQCGKCLHLTYFFELSPFEVFFTCCLVSGFSFGTTPLLNLIILFCLSDSELMGSSFARPGSSVFFFTMDFVTILFSGVSF